MTASRTDLAQFIIHGHDGDRIDSTDETSPIRLGPNPMMFGDTVTDMSFTSPAHMTSGDVLDAPPRDVGTLEVVDVVLLGESHQHLLELVERFVVATDPTRGEILVESRRPDGTGRVKRMIRSQAFRPDLGQFANTEAQLQVAFRAQHPYWLDIDPQVIDISFPVTGTGVAAATWNAVQAWNAPEPWNGWNPTASGGEATIDLFLDSSAHSWPLWTLSGTATRLELTNLSSKRPPLVWEGTKGAGDIEIETRQRSQHVRYDGTESRAGELVRGSDMWPLVPKRNLISVKVSSADTTTRLTMTVTKEYRTC